MAGLLTSLQRKLNPIKPELREPYEATKAYYESISGASNANLNAKFEAGEIDPDKFEKYVTNTGRPLYRQLVAAGNRGRANAHWARESAARMKVQAITRKKMAPVNEMKKKEELAEYVRALKAAEGLRLKHQELASPKYTPPTTIPAAKGTGLGGGRRRVSRTRKSKKSKRGTRKH